MKNIWFQLAGFLVCVFFLPLWCTVDARNLFNSAASSPIFKAKAGRATECGSPSPAPASTANMTMPVTIALL